MRIGSIFRFSGGSSKVFLGGGVLGEQPSARKQHAVIKVHLVVSWLQFSTDISIYIYIFSYLSI